MFILYTANLSTRDEVCVCVRGGGGKNGNLRFTYLPFTFYTSTYITFALVKDLHYTKKIRILNIHNFFV